VVLGWKARALAGLGEELDHEGQECECGGIKGGICSITSTVISRYSIDEELALLRACLCIR
jgi:hypothetical protein